MRTGPLMNPALATLLSHPAIWRGDDCAPEPATLPSGFAALDAALPGRGWPQGALTEMLIEREGIGELRLALPALVRVQTQKRDVVWIAPPHRPYAPALAAAGLDLARFFVVRCRDGHLFTTVWLPGASFKAIRLGWLRLQRCPVGDHWSIVTPVRDEDLTPEQRRIARQHRDGPIL